MCGRYRRTTQEEELARLYHIPIPKRTDLPISYNIAPSQKVLTFRFNPETQARSLDALQWGLIPYCGCTPKPSKIPSKWISDFHSLVPPSFADIGSIFTATIPFVAEELRSISMRCWQTWHWKKATKGSLKPSNYGFDPIRPRNVMTNCLTEFSRDIPSSGIFRVWVVNLLCACVSLRGTRNIKA